MLFNVMLSYVTLRCVTLCKVMIFHVFATCCYIILRFIMLYIYYVMLYIYYVMLLRNVMLC